MSEPPTPLTTPLIDVHRELGGRLVDFAGWELPIQYEGIVTEHNACRNSAGLFDVSHMGVVELRAPGGVEEVAGALETVTPAAIISLGPGRMRYGLLTNESGGAIDDFMVTNLGDHLVIVVNAARRSVDLPHLRACLPGIEIIERDDVALLALQGPAAGSVLSTVTNDADDFVFLDAAVVALHGSGLDGTEALVSRSGYTGEDGFEICVPADVAAGLARKLVDHPDVTPCGLGARDTLRLEAGLCLYGHDLDETTSPVEADLAWTMPKRRREAGDFPGAERILAEHRDGPSRRRVGLAAEGRRPVRDGAALKTADGEPAGVVTSGGYGPTVERPVAMGYVSADLATTGTQLVADVRGADVSITVTDLPFAPHRYRRPTS